MKNLFKHVLLLTFTMMIAISCGSDSKKKSTAPAPAPVDTVDVDDNDSTQSLSSRSYNVGDDVSLDDLQDEFERLDYRSNGVAFDDHLYFIKRRSGGSFQVSANFCLNLGFWASRGCNQNSSVDYLNQLLDRGEMFRVEETNGDSVGFSKVTEFDVYGRPYYSDVLYLNKDQNLYKNMIGLGSSSSGIGAITGGAYETKVTAATIVIDGQPRRAFHVESADSIRNSNIESFIVVPELPLIANPVAIFKKSSGEDMVLKAYNESVVQSISFVYHVQSSCFGPNCQAQVQKVPRSIQL